jgi:hypothetical protein
LIWFGDRKLWPALAEGLKAMIMHWKPFLMLALGLFAVSIPVVIVTAVLVGMAGSGGLMSVVMMACIMILLLAFQMLLFATQYCSYRDIFGIGKHPELPSDEDDSQFVA